MSIEKQGEKMNKKLQELIKNFSYTLTSNIFTMLISAVSLFLMPKVIDIEAYGYWQLFIFYSSYVPFLQFGWSDGIYLRYGGEKKENLDNKLFYSQFLSLLVFQLTISFVIIGITLLSGINDVNKSNIIILTMVYMVLVNVRYLFLYVLQATNRFKEYSTITIYDRILYIVFIVIGLLFKSTNYNFLIYADIGSKFFTLLVCIYICRDFAMLKISSFRLSIKETIMNIQAGIQIMFSNTASMLIIGITRFGIERAWDVATFAKVSLTLSTSRFVMVFINALGIVMFPLLRRTEREKMPEIYIFMNKLYSLFIFGALLIYFPLKEILLFWLPEYSEGIKYMAFLFPMIVYEGKMSLIINPFLKTLRKEKELLKNNVMSMLFSLILTYLTTVFFKNLDYAIISIVIVLGLRCTLLDILLSKLLNVNIKNNIMIEFFFVILFIIIGMLMNTILALIIYLFVYSIYVLVNKQVLFDSLKQLRV